LRSARFRQEAAGRQLHLSQGMCNDEHRRFWRPDYRGRQRSKAFEGFSQAHRACLDFCHRIIYHRRVRVNSYHIRPNLHLPSNSHFKSSTRGFAHCLIRDREICNRIGQEMTSIWALQARIGRFVLFQPCVLIRPRGRHNVNSHCELTVGTHVGRSNEGGQ